MTISNPARPAPGAWLCPAADIAEGAAVCLEFAAVEARFSLIVARAGGRLAAYENRCPHAGLPLDRFDGAVLIQDRRFLVCAAHGASFELATGEAVAGPAKTGLARFPVREDAGAVWAA